MVIFARLLLGILGKKAAAVLGFELLDDKWSPKLALLQPPSPYQDAALLNELLGVAGVTGAAPAISAVTVRRICCSSSPLQTITFF